MLSNGFSPLIFAVLKEPLIASRNDTFVTRSRYNFSLWLVVWYRQSFVHEVLFYFWLRNLDFLAFSDAYDQLSFVEAFLVSLILSLLQEVLVVLRFDSELLNEGDGSQSSKVWDLNDLDWRKRNAPFFLDAELVSELGLCL